ncbi:MAG: hypothetical protein RL211_2173 [Pseudomonadota bacterium]
MASVTPRSDNAHANILCADDLLHFADAVERKPENAGIAAS